MLASSKRSLGPAFFNEFVVVIEIWWFLLMDGTFGSLHCICTVLAVEFGPHYSLTESFCLKILKNSSEMQSCKQSDLYILYRRQFRQSDGICQGYGNSLIIQKEH